MDYRILLKEENDAVNERFDLVSERIAGIAVEDSVPEPYRDYFKQTAEFILQMKQLLQDCENGRFDGMKLEELKKRNEALYEDILPGKYETSYANPAYAANRLGEDYGRLLSFLYAEIRGMIVYAYEFRLEDMTILCELFTEIYNCFEGITSISNCNTAMSMMVIGMILVDADPRTLVDKDILFYTVIRLAVIPFLVWLPCELLGLDSLVKGVSVLLAAMPAGATTTILASKYDGDAEFAVKLVVFSTAASLISTPLWSMLLL